MSNADLSVKYVKGRENVMRYLCQESTEASFGDDLLFVKRYLTPILRDQKGVGSSIANVECDFGILVFGNDQICLPTTFSVPIGLAEMKHNVFPWLSSSGQFGQNASYGGYHNTNSCQKLCDDDLFGIISFRNWR